MSRSISLESALNFNEEEMHKTMLAISDEALGDIIRKHEKDNSLRDEQSVVGYYTIISHTASCKECATRFDSIEKQVRSDLAR